jgi:hypothetical protein
MRGNDLVKLTFKGDKSILTSESYWLAVPSKQRTSVRGFMASFRSLMSVIGGWVKDVGKC